MSEVNTSPKNVGTYGITALGNSEDGDGLANYILTCVDLPTCLDEEIVFEQQEVQPGDTQVRYSFTYPMGQPTAHAQYRTYILPVFLPLAFEGEAFIPESIEVYNSSNEEERKTGKVRPQHTFKQRDLHYEDTDPSNPDIQTDVPRYEVLVNQTTPDNPTELYFIFIISKTNSNNERILSFNTDDNNPPNIICSYQVKSYQNPTPENRAAVTVAVTDPNIGVMSYESVGFLNNQPVLIEQSAYNSPELFHYEEVGQAM